MAKGYVVSQEEIDAPLPEFKEMATKGHASIDRNNLHFYAHHKNDDTQLIFIYFSDERNVGVTTMRKFLQQLEDKNIGRGIIIYQEKMTSSAHKVSFKPPPTPLLFQDLVGSTGIADNCSEIYIQRSPNFPLFF